MRLFGRNLTKELASATSALFERVQRLEEEHVELRARIEGERHPLPVTEPVIIAQPEQTPIPRGRAGGLARARFAWRYLDGTFMPESAKETAAFADYERYAAGGRKRAALAERAPDGTFLRSNAS